MLIIFDLDDTLIDTSGCVTPFKMKECLRRLIELGLNVPNFEQAYADLLDLNARSLRSKEAVEQFARSFGGGENLIKTVLQELSNPLPADFRVDTTPFAKEILEFYSKKFPLALVTGGFPPFQRDKLKKAGIEPSFFSKIAIPEDSVKKPCFQGLQREFGLDPQEIWVCGDRIEMDLSPARDLGFQTVHMRWGRGTLGARWPGHSITDLRELKGIIQ